MLLPLPDLTTSKKLATELVTISTLMQDSNIRLYDSLEVFHGYSRLKCVLTMSTKHDQINVHVVDVQSQVIANIKINFIHLCYWLISDKEPNIGREYKIRDF